MVDDEAQGFRALHIVDEVVDVESPGRINAELGEGDLKNPPFRFHDTRFVGIDAVAEEGAEEVILSKDMIVMDAADVGEEIERFLLMKRTSPFDHRGVHLKDPAPDLHEVILRAVMGKGLAHRLDEIGPADAARFMIHAKRMEIFLRGRCFLSGVFEDFLLRQRVVKGQEHIADIKDDCVDLHEKKAAMNKTQESASCKSSCGKMGEVAGSCGWNVKGLRSRTKTLKEEAV